MGSGSTTYCCSLPYLPVLAYSGREFYMSAWNGFQRGVLTNWQFTTEQARIKLRHRYPTID